MAATAGDVPGRYDVVINGTGFLELRALDSSLPFRVQRAVYGFSPTFLERTNTSGAYGDNQQDFWLTESQNDWSLGEQRRYYHPRSDPDNARRYWAGTNANVLVPGRVTLRQQVKSLAVGSTVRACCPRGQTASQNVVAAGTTNLFEYDPAGTKTDRGAHGLGAAPSRYGLCTDGTDVYLSANSAGVVRRWNGAAFSTFSTVSGADSLGFLNNTLYGVRGTTSDLVRFDTVGSIGTPIFTWKTATGAARGGNPGPIEPFGGQLAICWSDGPKGSELWFYDGSSPRLAMQIDSNFWAHDMLVVGGTIFIGGSYIKILNGATGALVYRPAIYYWASGSEGVLWQANDYSTTSVASAATAGHAALAAYQTGLVFNDDTAGTFLHYEFATGGIHTIGSYTVAGDTPLLTSSQQVVLHTRNQATAYLYPDTTSLASTATVTSSLMDLENSLTKLFREIKVDADLPTGSSVDIAYQIDSVDGSFTTLQTSATSGTAYTLPSMAQGRAISVKTTLNLGTSTTSPALKRFYLRAAPKLQAFQRDEFILDCSGSSGRTPVGRNDGSDEPLSGTQLVKALRATALAAAPVQITTRFGTYTGVIENDFMDIIEIRAGEFIARVKVREV